MTREEMESSVVRLGIVKPEVIKHICDMMEGIQEYIMTRKPTSKFMKLCGDEDWEYAKSVGDIINKEVLQIGFYQDFVKKIKTSPKYISKIRDEKLNDIGI